MKKFLALTSLLCALFLSGCNMCAGATAMSVYSPWGRTDVLEISTYAVSAEKPTEDELGGFNIGYFIVGTGNYVTKTTTQKGEDDKQLLVIENTFSFTGKYYAVTDPDNAIKPVTATEFWNEDGTFTDSYTARVVINGLSKNTMNAKESERTASVTFPKPDGDSWYLARADYKQTISYGETQATAKVENTDLSATLTEKEIATLHCGSGTDFEKTYSYKNTDLVYDNESFAAVLRAYSVNAEFGKGNTTPTGFKVLNPRANALVEMSFSATETTYTQTPFQSDVHAADAQNPNFTSKEVTDAEIFKVSLRLNSEASGQPKVFYILKDEKVKYQTDSGGYGEPVALNRVIFIEDDMHMDYRLTQYVNASPKEA